MRRRRRRQRSNSLEGAGERLDLGLVARMLLGLQRRDQLVDRGDGGADLADHDAGRQIGELGRLEERQPCRERRRERRHDRVARARNIEHLARRGGNMVGLVGRHQDHALAPPRREHRAEAMRRDQRARRLDRLLVAAHRQTRRRGQLGAVRRDDGGAAIDAVVGRLGIDDDRPPRRARGGDRLAEQAARQRALAVIGQHHHRGLAQGGVQGGHEAGLARRLDRLHRLMVRPQELLRAGDEARFDAGLAPGFGEELGLDARLERHQASGLAPRLVVADDGEEARPGAQRRDVARDIAGTPQHDALALDAQHRDGRLGRDALDRPVDIAVDHEVAQAKHPRARERPGMVEEGGAIGHAPLVKRPPTARRGSAAVISSWIQR